MRNDSLSVTGGDRAFCQPRFCYASADRLLLIAPLQSQPLYPPFAQSIIWASAPTNSLWT